MAGKLFLNGKIWQPDGRFKESFGISNGTVDFCSSNPEAQDYSDKYSETIDLGGRLVLPGLTDGHLHLVYGSMMRKKLDCRNVKSLQELKKIILDFESKNRKSEWIIGSNLDLPLLLGKDFKPAESFVDEIYSEKPLFIANYDYHSAICNSLALNKSGLLKRIKNFSEVNVPKNNVGRAYWYH